MKFVIKFVAAATFCVIIVFAAIVCEDILTALAPVKEKALPTDNCVTTTDCQNGNAKITYTCTYTTALTEAEKSKNL